MAIDTTLLSSDLDYIISDLETTVTISGTDYPCTRSRLTHEQIYTDYGLGDEYKFTIYLNYTDFDTIPENHTLVTIASVEYRILGQEPDSAFSLLRLHLGNKYGKLD